MPVNIHGNEYTMVAERVSKFREDHPEYEISTKIVSESGKLIVVRASIKDNSGRLIATGHAEEDRTIGKINQTSALENCETSAVGRALAFYGLAGTEIRSADEMSSAVIQQAMQAQIEYMEMVRDEWPTIAAVKDFLGEEIPNVDAAREAFKELTEDLQRKLWKAPTKGGVFTTLERKLLKEGQA